MDSNGERGERHWAHNVRALDQRIAAGIFVIGIVASILADCHGLDRLETFIWGTVAVLEFAVLVGPIIAGWISGG